MIAFAASTSREEAVARLYGDLHAYGDHSAATAYLLTGLSQHFLDLGLSPSSALAGAHVLDAGCGGFAGGAAAALALGAAHVTAVDLSTDNVLAARRCFRNVSNVDVRCQNVLRLDLTDGRFDFVYSNGVPAGRASVFPQARTALHCSRRSRIGVSSSAD